MGRRVFRGDILKGMFELWIIMYYIIIIGLFTGVVYSFFAIWRIMKAQESIAESMQEVIALLKDNNINKKIE